MRLILALLLTAAAAQAAHVQFDVNNFVSGAISRRVLDIAPTSAPYTNPAAPAIITEDPIRYYTDTSGQCIVSNMFGPRVYQVTIFGPRSNTVFNISVPAAEALTNAVYLVTEETAVSDSSAYTQSQSDARFVLRTSGYGTNTALDNASLTNPIVYANLTLSENVYVGDFAYVPNLIATNAYLLPGEGSSNQFLRLINAGTGESEWAAAPGAGGGEDNYNADAATTNTTTTFGLVSGRAGTTNTLKVLKEGNGIQITNENDTLTIASTATGGTVTVQTNSTDIGTESRLNLLAGANIVLVATNFSGTNYIWITSTADGALILEDGITTLVLESD